ncbi:MAG: SusE domain-containing protein [Saprospiraceae bacterium]|nr:SusE domain-containing protein [Saprospiraceae bacterium]
MKSIYNFFLAGLVFAALSCSNDPVGPTLVNDNIAAPIITAPAANTAITLTEATLNGDFPKFTWSGADYGFPAGVQYTLEADLAASDFADPVALGNTRTNEFGVLNSKINSILLIKNVPDKVLTDVAFRLVAKISDEVPLVYSDPLVLKIAPVKVKVDYPKLQVPGSYQGWNPGDPKTVIFSTKNDGKFEGYAYFGDPNTEFKYTNGPSWDENYGDTGADGTLDRNGDNLRAVEPGMYKLNVNINTLAHTYVPANWGIIGSGTPTGWDSDTDMVYDPVSGTLKVTLALSEGGEIKFRANDAWDLNFGDDNTNGSLEYGGANIPVPAGGGTFEIELILNTGDYTYKLTKK